MGRPVGSKNKNQEVVGNSVETVDKNIPSGTPHKHLVENMDDKNIRQESGSMSLRESIANKRAEKLSDLPQSIYEELAEIASANSIATTQAELSELYTRLRKEGNSQEASLREMRGYVQSSSPSRLHEAARNNVALSSVSHAAPQVRQLSTNKDHMGEGEPLCFECGHRSDMHHLWNYHEKEVTGKNLQGDILSFTKEWKTKRFDEGNRPCQHACLCKNYK